METITLAHGNGGQLTQELIEDIIYRYCGNDILLTSDDAAYLPKVEGQLVTSTDSFVVDPLFFPGGDIGKLAVCGTVNDLAVNGAQPLYLTVGLILEEGLKLDKLKRIMQSIAKTAQGAGIKVVAGDTKVVPQGKGGEIYINTTGLGVVGPGINLQDVEIEIGDKIIISGSIGDHGATILAQREGFEVSSALKSDCTLLHNLTAQILSSSKGIKFLTDPTRGGLATALHEIAQQNQVAINLEAAKLPIKKEVQGLGEILGIAPLYLASEGRVLGVVAAEEAETVVKEMQTNPRGKGAVVIGEVTGNKSQVCLKTNLGGTRILRPLHKQLLPRIC